MGDLQLRILHFLTGFVDSFPTAQNLQEIWANAYETRESL